MSFQSSLQILANSSLIMIDTPWTIPFRMTHTKSTNILQNYTIQTQKNINKKVSLAELLDLRFVKSLGETK